MCVYIYTYIYTHMYAYIYICIYICKCICMYMYTYIYMYIYLNEHISIHECRPPTVPSRCPPPSCFLSRGRCTCLSRPAQSGWLPLSPATSTLPPPPPPSPPPSSPPSSTCGASATPGWRGRSGLAWVLSRAQSAESVSDTTRCVYINK